MTDLAQMVRQGDPDRFAATMAAPAALRGRLWPVYALNLELARAPWASANPLLAEMRLQWWADQIVGLGQGAVSTDPVLTALAPLVAQAPEMGIHLSALASARRADCWDEPFADSDAFTVYIDATAGSVMQAANLAVGGAGDLGAFARAQGMASYLCAVPQLQRRGRTPLRHIDNSTLQQLARTAVAALNGAQALSGPSRAAAYPAVLARAILRQVIRTPEAVRNGHLGLSEFARRAAFFRLALMGHVG